MTEKGAKKRKEIKACPHCQTGSREVTELRCSACGQVDCSDCVSLRASVSIAAAGIEFPEGPKCGKAAIKPIDVVSGQYRVPF